MHETCTGYSTVELSSGHSYLFTSTKTHFLNLTVDSHSGSVIYVITTPDKEIHTSTGNSHSLKAWLFFFFFSHIPAFHSGGTQLFRWNALSLRNVQIKPQQAEGDLLAGLHCLCLQIGTRHSFLLICIMNTRLWIFHRALRKARAALWGHVLARLQVSLMVYGCAKINGIANYEGAEFSRSLRRANEGTSPRLLCRIESAWEGGEPHPGGASSEKPGWHGTNRYPPRPRPEIDPMTAWHSHITPLLMEQRTVSSRSQ